MTKPRISKWKRFLLWVIIAIGSILLLDYVLYIRDVPWYETTGYFDISSGDYMNEAKVLNVTVRRDIQATDWTPFAKAYLPPQTEHDWHYVGAEFYWLLIRTHDHGEGQRDLQAVDRLQYLFKLVEFTDGAKGVLARYLVDKVKQRKSYIFAFDFIGWLGDAAYPLNRPVGEEDVVGLISRYEEKLATEQW